MEKYKITSNGGTGEYTEADTGETYTLLQLVNKMINLCNKILNLLPISTDNVADLSITTQKLADLSVTTQKLADASVTTDKIQDGAITLAKMAENSVNASKIEAGAVTLNKIPDNTITPAKLKTDGQDEWPLYNVNSEKVYVNTILPKNTKINLNGTTHVQNDLEVDGNITSGTASFDIWKSKDIGGGTQVLQFRENEGAYELYTYYTLNVSASIKAQSLYCSSLFPHSIYINEYGSITIGTTRLDEATLKKLIALIPTT